MYNILVIKSGRGNILKDLDQNRRIIFKNVLEVRWDGRL
jgi:hypothetical protein